MHVTNINTVKNTNTVVYVICSYRQVNLGPNLLWQSFYNPLKAAFLSHTEFLGKTVVFKRLLDIINKLKDFEVE